MNITLWVLIITGITSIINLVLLVVAIFSYKQSSQLQKRQIAEIVYDRYKIYITRGREDYKKALVLIKEIFLVDPTHYAVIDYLEMLLINNKLYEYKNILPKMKKYHDSNDDNILYSFLNMVYLLIENDIFNAKIELRELGVLLRGENTKAWNFKDIREIESSLGTEEKEIFNIAISGYEEGYTKIEEYLNQ